MMQQPMMPQQPTAAPMVPQQPMMQQQPMMPQQPMVPQPTNIPPAGTSQHATNPYANVYTPPPMNNLTNGFHNMSLIAPSNNLLHHATSNPDLHQINSTLMPNMHHSTSVPAHMNKAGQNRIPGHAFGSMTPPPSSSNTPPLVQPRSGSATPPHAFIHKQTPNGRKMSAPSIPCINSSIFSQHSTPTMLQSSHLKGSAENSPVTTPVKNASPIMNHQPSSLTPRVSPMPPSIPDHLGANIYNRSHSNPEAFRKVSPVNVAPPTMGYYAYKTSSGANSPKSISPAQSGHSSPVPSLDPSLLENDNVALTNTMNLLNSFKSRCSCNMTTKLSDDISKKLQTFETVWRSGKLSSHAKSKMLQLSQGKQNSDLH